MNRTPLFFEAYRKTGSISAATAVAGVSRQAHYQRLQRNKEYRKAFAAVHAETIARLLEEAGQRAQDLQRLELAKQDERMRALHDRWHKVRQALEYITGERAAEMADIPGGKSGFLARDFKGKDATREIYRVDAGTVSLLVELRAMEKQAAEQLGQWVQKSEHVGEGGGPLSVEVIFKKPEDVNDSGEQPTK